MPKTQKNDQARAARRAPPDDSVQLDGKRADFLSLPAKVRSMIESEGLPRLRRIREAVAADAGLPMPPVRVEPWGWVSPLQDTVLFAKASLIAVRDNRAQWGAIFPASTLFVVTDDALLRRLLCHEFAHCFWFIAQALTDLTAHDSRWKSDHDLPPEELLAKQIARDRDELIDPAAWFGEWDARNFLVDTDHHDYVAPTQDILEKWVGAGFPIRKANFEVWIPSSDFCRCKACRAALRKLNSVSSLARPVEMPEEVVRRVQVVRTRFGGHDINVEIPEEVVRRAREVASNTGRRPQVPPAPKPR